MSQHDNISDQDFDDALLSSRYKTIPKEQPPRAIDRVIIKSARDAVKKENKKTTSRFSGWLMPLATVASVLVVVGVLRLLPQDRIYPLPTQPESPDVLEEEAAALSAPGGKRSQRESKAESGRVRDKSAPSDELLEQDVQHRASKNIASDALPDEEQAVKGKVAKSTVDTISEKTESPAPGLTMEKVPTRSVTEFSSLVTREQWIEHITDLIEQDKMEKAKSAFKEFVQRYPSDPHIAELRVLLKESPIGP